MRGDEEVSCSTKTACDAILSVERNGVFWSGSRFGVSANNRRPPTQGSAKVDRNPYQNDYLRLGFQIG